MLAGTPRLHRTAVLSEDKKNRYALEQRLNHDLFAPTRGRVMFLMLNPSVADVYTDDMTFTKCIGFSERWGFEDVAVGNLYPVRETYAKELFNAGAGYKIPDSYEDPEALRHLERMAMSSRQIVCAWGGDVLEAGQASVRILNHLFDLVPTTPFLCLGRTRNGYPKHPSRLAYDTELVPFYWYRRVRVEVWAGPPWWRKATDAPPSTAELNIPYWIKHGTPMMGTAIGNHIEGITTPAFVRSGSHHYKLHYDPEYKRVRGIHASPATAAAELAAHPDWHRQDLVHFPDPRPHCRFPTLDLDGYEEDPR